MTKQQEGDLISVEIHAPGQSRHNAEELKYSMHTFQFGQVIQMALKASKTVQINTPKQPCYENNDHSSTECVYKYIEEDMGCQLPWVGEKSKHSNSYF